MNLYLAQALRSQMQWLEVTDDGVGTREPLSEGVGLGNARARLASLYGTRHRLDAGPGHHGGFLVKIEIPWRTEPGLSGEPVTAAGARA